MPFYVKQGNIPRKRHTVFKKKDGTLHFEELMGRQGFSGNSTNMYHLRMPTRVSAVGARTPIKVKAAATEHRNRHIKTFEIKSSGDALASRRLLLFNADVLIYKCHVDEDMQDFYRNGHYDELFYVQEGKGTLQTQLGDLAFHAGDYIVIPRGIIWKMFVKGRVSLLLVESAPPIFPPSHYRTRSGQFHEQSPFCERDIRLPELSVPVDEEGAFDIKTRIVGAIQTYTYDSHPFDVVGWDGFHYPWIFNINDFEPIVGSIHQPPPIHQTFETSALTRNLSVEIN